MRLLIALALVASVLPPLASAEARPQAAPSDAGETADVSPSQQRAVDELLAAINAGGGKELDDWIERHALLRPTKGATSWRDWFGRIARTSGGLALDHVDPPTANGELRVWVRTGRGEALRRFSLFTDAAGSERLSDFLIAVWPAPYPGPLIRTPATQEQLAELVRARVAFGAERDEFSGAALLAAKGREVASASAGMADVGAARPNSLDTRFHIGSMGKMFTAVAIARQVQEGRLRLDTRLIEVLPDYPDVEAARSITIAHLLSHTSGISLPYIEPTASMDADPERVSDALARIASQPLAFEPGSRSSYSNEGYTVLGAVLEAVTGQTYYEVIQKVVFDPAGMADTAFDRPGEAIADTAVGYRYAADDALGVMPREPNTPFLLDRGGPAGGAYSTVRDLTAFLNAFRDGRLLSLPMMEALLTAEPNGLNRYGKGFAVIPVGERRMVGHSGGGPNSGINADAMIVWETGWSYAVAGNYDAPAAQAVAGASLLAAAAQPGA